MSSRHNEHFGESLIELASIDPPHWNGIQVDPFQASDVDAPAAELGYALSDFLTRPMPRPPEGQDAANRAEVILSSPRVPLVEGEVFERREEPKVDGVHSVNQRSSPATD